MKSFASPLFLLMVTLFVMLINLSERAVMVFPFLEHLVKDPTTQGYLTVCLLWGTVGLSLLWASADLVISEVRRSRDLEPEPPSDR